MSYADVDALCDVLIKTIIHKYERSSEVGGVGSMRQNLESDVVPWPRIELRMPFASLDRAIIA